MIKIIKFLLKYTIIYTIILIITILVSFLILEHYFSLPDVAIGHLEKKCKKIIRQEPDNLFNNGEVITCDDITSKKITKYHLYWVEDIPEKEEENTVRYDLEFTFYKVLGTE